ncbi:uncharacterized membrane protein (DUF485 family) [Streptomyces sp. SLBN-118]|uniref:DUF485 domain-containing protein n=1 Tax=Streptomyces sp. SLBN-118 TaxID=2768454 RepID=UPI00115253B9|nr:DUF485 domain-containing protein [Streptomyces sp. SLBN-118]TQK50155.1 uncharacterized membrane protein (DUF485 family) [Streptomyces sp. SLBN-118]
MSSPPEPPQETQYSDIRDTKSFAELRSRFRRFSFSMTGAFLLFYVFYVVLCTYAPHLVATKVIGDVNIALLLGLAQFASTFVIAWLYTRHAKKRLDPLADSLRFAAQPAIAPLAPARGEV